MACDASPETVAMVFSGQGDSGSEVLLWPCWWRLLKQPGQCNVRSNEIRVRVKRCMCWPRTEESRGLSALLEKIFTE